MNHVTLVGTIASHIRLQEFGTGDAVRTKASFVCAVHRRRRPAPPDWIRVETWGPQATTLVRSNGRGSRIAIDGHVRGQFFNPDGTDRGGPLRLTVVADTITYLSPPRPTAASDSPLAEPATAEPEAPPRGRR